MLSTLTHVTGKKTKTNICKFKYMSWLFKPMIYEIQDLDGALTLTRELKMPA